MENLGSAVQCFVNHIKQHWWQGLTLCQESNLKMFPLPLEKERAKVDLNNRRENGMT